MVVSCEIPLLFPPVFFTARMKNELTCQVPYSNFGLYKVFDATFTMEKPSPEMSVWVEPDKWLRCDLPLLFTEWKTLDLLLTFCT